MKVCRNCKEEKELDEFYVSRKSKDGKTSYCKECSKARAMKQYAEQKDELLARRKAGREADPAKHAAQIASWRARNPERAQYHSRLAVQRHAERYRENAKKYDARKRGATITPLPRGAIKKVLAYYGECLKCHSKEDLTIDHVIPVSLGGEHAVHNMQVLCRSCNCKKGNRSSADYRQVPLIAITSDGPVTSGN